MSLSQTKVVDYTVKWLEDQGWDIIYAHYPEGHHISTEYGRLKIIHRKFVDIVAKKGKCLFLIQCNARFKLQYLEKLKKINKEHVRNIEFEILVKGIAFHKTPSTQDIVKSLEENCLLLEVKGEDLIKMYGIIPTECLGA